jgi:hypothetical protein
METGLQQMTMAKIIGIQPPGQGMLFKKEGALPETGCSNTGGQPGQAAADYDKLIISQQRSDVFQLWLKIVDATG